VIDSSKSTPRWSKLKDCQVTRKDGETEDEGLDLWKWELRGLGESQIPVAQEKGMQLFSPSSFPLAQEKVGRS
jgi:hypothetical protein